MQRLRGIIGEKTIILHQVHYDEATRRLRDAVFQLANTGQNGDECLSRLAKQVIQKLGSLAPRARSLGELGRSRIRVMQEAQRLLRGLLRDNNIDIVDDYAYGTSRGEEYCPYLSPEDQLLVKLAMQCYSIMSLDNGVIDCCANITRNAQKCIRPDLI